MNRIQKARNYGINIFNLWWSWRKALLKQELNLSPEDTIPFAMQVELLIHHMKTRSSRLRGKESGTREDTL